MTDLARFVAAHPRLLVLTGAGVSTASGIPAYRDAHGHWQRRSPVTHQQFITDAAVRRRYWGRSMVGWPHVAAARPNAAHVALAQMEQRGYVHVLVTQNVDGLHQRAGSVGVIDLHGRLDQVVCLDCAHTLPRAAMQALLVDANAPAGMPAAPATFAPDGDADVDAAFDAFSVPPCPMCAGMLKPDVVLHGANVPRDRVDAALAALAAADALLVVGSSLTVYSGFRFCVRAHELGLPIAIVNRGETRGDALAALRVDEDCSTALADLGGQLDTRDTTTASGIVRA